MIEAFQVFPYHVPVRNLLVSQDQIIVLSDHEVNAFPLHRCEKISNCGDCVALQDPYCAWDLSERACVAHNQLKWSGLIQDLEHGYHEGCPLPEPGTVDNFLRKQCLQHIIKSLCLKINLKSLNLQL